MKNNSIFSLLLFCLFILIEPAYGQVISTIAGNGSSGSTGDGGAAVAATLNNPGGVFYDRHGNIFVTEYSGSKVRKINTSGIISTFAGTGTSGFSGDGGPATAALFTNLIDVIGDYNGNLYLVDNINQRIRKVDTFGIVTTFVGTGSTGYTGDGGPATAATMQDPNRLGIDAVGNIYFADANNNAIRKINTSGIISTVAGIGSPGFSGDGGPATSAALSTPLGVGFDALGNMFIADAGNHRIRKVDVRGIISTVAGNGSPGYSGDGGMATAATLDYPNGITVDATCNVYFADWSQNVIRKITNSGFISTVVATGTAGYAGDGGPAIYAQLNGPNNLCFDPYMNLYIPEYYNNRIRKVVQLGDTSGCPGLVVRPSFTVSDDTLCQDSCITAASTSTGPIDSMRWKVAPAGASIASPSLSTTTICFPSAGVYSVKLYVYAGAAVDSSTKTITVKQAPHPRITRTGYVLSATGSGYTNYQWRNGTTAISGATTSSYTMPVTGGNFSVTVDSAGCTGTSNYVNTTGISDLNSFDVNYWITDNVVGQCQLHASEPVQESLTIIVFDMQGRKIAEETMSAGAQVKVLSLGWLSESMYVVKVCSAHSCQSIKWIVTK